MLSERLIKNLDFLYAFAGTKLKKDRLELISSATKEQLECIIEMISNFRPLGFKCKQRSRLKSLCDQFNKNTKISEKRTRRNLELEQYSVQKIISAVLEKLIQQSLITCGEDYASF